MFTLIKQININYTDVDKEIERSHAQEIGNNFILWWNVMNYVGTINLKHICEGKKKGIFLSGQI